MRRGLSRPRAYELVQRCALDAVRNGSEFMEVLSCDPRIRRHLTPNALARCLDPKVHLRHVDRIFQRVGL